MASTRLTHKVQPSAKLLESADNGGEIELSLHHKAIATATAKHIIPLTFLEPTRKTTSDDSDPVQSGPLSNSLKPSLTPCGLSQNVTKQSTERDATDPDDTPFPRINKCH